jgi:hypothetical protein
MVFHAWKEFYRDKAMMKYPAACCVYASMLGLENIFFEPRPIKAWVLAEALEMEKETVLKALNKLVEKGYIIEHARTTNNVRTFTIAIERRSSTPEPPANAA